jgi:hypothetical protein
MRIGLRTDARALEVPPNTRPPGGQGSPRRAGQWQFALSKHASADSRPAPGSVGHPDR